MSSLDVSDSQITMAYDALTKNDSSLRWFLLGYGDKPNLLSLRASGTGDLDELRSRVTPGSACYGVFREHDNDRILSVAIIPDSIRGVRRARTHVHAHTVSSMFKAFQAITVSDAEQITTDALRNASVSRRGDDRPTLAQSTTTKTGMSQFNPGLLELTPQFSTSSLSSNPSLSIFGEITETQSQSPNKASNLSPMPSSHLPLSEPSSVTSSPQAHTGHSASTLPRADLSQHSAHLTAPELSSGEEFHLLPTTFSNVVSPGDPRTRGLLLNKQERTVSQPLPSVKSHLRDSSHIPGPKTSFESEASDYTPQSPIGSIPDEHLTNVHVPPSPPYEPSSTNGTSTPAQEEVDRVRNMWEHDHVGEHPPTPPSKEETPYELKHYVTSPSFEFESHYARRGSQGSPDSLRDSAHRRDSSQEAHTPLAIHSRFLERAAAAGPETLEEERRLALLAEERQRRAAERARRERQEREEEEEKDRAFAERKEREHARRILLARQGEERRAEERKREAQARAEREAREAQERELRAAKDRAAREKAQQRIEMTSSAGLELLSGFVTMETAGVWKRRYFRLSTDSWLFFRNDIDVEQPAHVIELAIIRALREWNEGYEELEAIPHSFAVELLDDVPIQFFADSAEDKEILLGLLNQAARL